MIDREREFGCAMGVILLGGLITHFSQAYFWGSEEVKNNDLNVSQPKATKLVQSPETMTFLASEIMGDYKVIYFDTDNDLSTAEKSHRIDLSDKNFLKIYNLKRGDVVKKSDWTKIVRRAQQEKIRE